MPRPNQDRRLEQTARAAAASEWTNPWPLDLTGSGEPLVLLHGIGGTWREWSPVLSALECDFDVLALDLPGFGQSPPLPGAAITVPSLAEAVEREMDSAGFGRAHLVGNSSGGWIALELARRGRASTVVALRASSHEPAGEALTRSRHKV